MKCFFFFSVHLRICGVYLFISLVPNRMVLESLKKPEKHTKNNKSSSAEQGESGERLLRAWENSLWQ